MRRLASAVNARALLVGTVVLAIAVTGGALAASGGPGTIVACVHRHGGALYQVKKCSSGDKRLSWNVHGAAGAKGSAGPIGPRGPVGVQGATGMQGATGVTGLAGAAVGYSASTTTDTNILSSPATVLSKSLPAGSYSITSKVEIDADGTQNQFTVNYCTLTDGSTRDISTYSAPLVVPEIGFYASFGIVDNQLTLTTAGQSSVTLACGDNSEEPEPSSETATNAQLSALQLSALNQ